MKTSILISLALAGFATAEFETWTNSEGRSADLELTAVSETAGEKVGTFKLRNGQTTTLKASQLSAEDAKRLAAWKPAEAPPAAAPSVFDKLLDGDLVSLDGRSLKRHKEPVTPTKYYLFYYTASWCGPCQQFTPSLVEFYDKNRPGNDKFEVILITSDSSEDAMEIYALNKKMKWPHLKLSKAAKFKQEVGHPGTGIPNLVLTDLDGNILKSSYEGGKYIGPAVVMNHLGSLLKD